MKHGRWCRLRSFPMTCKFCGAKLLFWECEHGCKLLFEFDKNGRLAGHHKCSGSMANIRPSRKLRPRPPAISEEGFDISSVSKAFIEQLFKEAFQCPVCKDKFASEASYYQHLRQKRSTDEAHEAFYNENGRVIENLEPAGVETGPLPSSSPALATPGLEPDKVTAFPTEHSTINAFGGIRFKGKDGTVKMVKTYKDWWDEFSENEGEKGSRC
jgi:DNA-directed RNA polymerase subunit M/transcription elongation factor TFIIS